MNPNEQKSALTPYFDALAAGDVSAAKNRLNELCTTDANLRVCHPFDDLTGATAFHEACLLPLEQALPDLERRDMIRLAGTTEQGQHWVGAMGNYLGTFTSPFLDIPPTGGLVHMRYHEFFRLEAGKLIEMQAVWDIPELMMQAGAWPLAPQLGAFLATPAPLTSDGLTASGDGADTMAMVLAMLEDLNNHPNNPDPASMQLDTYWHPRCNWYGPAGIGTARGIAGFRHWHQIPFLSAMPDRGLDGQVELSSHWVAEGNYVCETGWPNMRMTVTGDGWMGVAPAGQTVELRSLDFWRQENGLIRENWVLIDLLDFYRQVGVDVLGRMREFNKARNLGSIILPNSLKY